MEIEFAGNGGSRRARRSEQETPESPGQSRQSPRPRTRPSSEAPKPKQAGGGAAGRKGAQRAPEASATRPAGDRNGESPRASKRPGERKDAESAASRKPASFSAGQKKAGSTKAGTSKPATPKAGTSKPATPKAGTSKPVSNPDTPAKKEPKQAARKNTPSRKKAPSDAAREPMTASEASGTAGGQPHPTPQQLASEALRRAGMLEKAAASAHGVSGLPAAKAASETPRLLDPGPVARQLNPGDPQNARLPAGPDSAGRPEGSGGGAATATAVAEAPSASAAEPQIIGELDLYLTGQGSHERLWEKMGAHLISRDGIEGVAFAVWAPNATGVSVIGDFNEWDGRVHPMRSLGVSGIWYRFIPGLKQGDLYKYEIRTREGHLRIKADPFAFACELRPGTASKVWDLSKYQWNDGSWMESRRNRDLRREPMNIYEMHLGSWMRAPERNNGWLTYREIADRLVDHLHRYNFNYVEFLPVAEHPFDQSWGYQVTGYYAPTSRHGTPDDFKYLVDTLHQAGIGVITDWVPAHFPKDDTALRWFDGTALYEHADPRQGEHRDWGTLIFNYGRNEVRNFLLANALFWLDAYHIDSLRVDAVASMLYLNYSRQEGDWIPNRYGGKENLEAIDFLRRMNELVYALYPGAFTIAEESTDWGGVTLPTYLGGLGFGFKWDMGWMHDTLVYFTKDPIHRKFHHNQLTFGMLYAYTENFIDPLSHDEVVYGKRSLLNKMPGDEWQRFANLRALYAYMYTRPGKKLLFMGAEFGQEWEWRFDHSLDWHLCELPNHKGIELLMEDLGRLYRHRDVFWAWDAEPRGFEWIDANDGDASVFSYMRRGPNGYVIVVLNLTPVPRLGHRIGVPEGGYYREILNSDSKIYGGSDLGNGGGLMADEVASHGRPWSLNLTLPPLAAVVLEPAR